MAIFLFLLTLSQLLSSLSLSLSLFLFLFILHFRFACVSTSQHVFIQPSLTLTFFDWFQLVAPFFQVLTFFKTTTDNIYSTATTATTSKNKKRLLSILRPFIVIVIYFWNVLTKHKRKVKDNFDLENGQFLSLFVCL